MGRATKGNDYSNHPFSGAMLVSGRVRCLPKNAVVCFCDNFFPNIQDVFGMLANIQQKKLGMTQHSRTTLEKTWKISSFKVDRGTGTAEGVAHTGGEPFPTSGVSVSSKRLKKKRKKKKKKKKKYGFTAIH